MKILIEECRYDAEVLKGVLPHDKLLMTDNKIKIEHVGYFRSSECDDFVFFLPKVVLEPKTMPNGVEEDRVLCTQANPNGWSPEEIMDPEKLADDKNHPLGQREKEFLYEFAVWIYRAIARFDELHPGSDAVWRRKEKQSGGFRRNHVTNTLLDVILALIRFNRDNQDYFTFRVKEKHSGLNKINWTRTISKETAVVQNGNPLYLQTRNKKKTVNFDEELLVIFYSILDYTNRHYGFNARFNLGYDLIPQAEFNRYLSGYGETRLRQIKYKYYSDRDLALWDLCFAFFHKAHRANVVAEGEEYLIAKNFEIIFESMVDDLIGDRSLDELKELDDGKEIDHLYLDESLTRNDGRQTFYIADSKYYKIGRFLERKSIVKQFTYAKDMLQLNLDLFLPGEYASAQVQKWRKPFRGKNVDSLRDEETEGYDVIPNFFISARMDPEFNYDKDGLSYMTEDDNAGLYHNIQFPNRLFDRDTLILSHYNLNFLYLIKLYSGKDTGARTAWRNKVRKDFRERIRKVLSDRFEFRAIMPHDGIDPDLFFKENLNVIIGKIFAPYPSVGDRKVYMVALLKKEIGDVFPHHLVSSEGQELLRDMVFEENEETLRLLESAFYVTKPIALGTDPSNDLMEMLAANPIMHAPASDVDSGVQVISGVSGGLKVAVDTSGWCACPVSQCPTPEAIKLLVLPHTMGANLYHVIDGTLKKFVSPEALASLANGAFAKVKFPSQPYHVWQVQK